MRQFWRLLANHLLIYSPIKTRLHLYISCRSFSCSYISWQSTRINWKTDGKFIIAVGYLPYQEAVDSWAKGRFWETFFLITRSIRKWRLSNVANKLTLKYLAYHNHHIDTDCTVTTHVHRVSNVCRFDISKVRIFVVFLCYFDCQDLALSAPN
jgi:hypothetical protein